MPAILACGVLGNGLSPISSSTTSFPLALRFRARASTVNAVSAVKVCARVLSRGMRGFFLVFLARCDHLRQRPDDAGDDGSSEHLLADFALALKRLQERLIGPAPPVLADREVYADLIV